MKKLTSSTLALAVILGGGMGLAMPDRTEAQTRELRLAEFGPNRGARAGGLEWLDQELRARSGGALGLNIIWGGALVSATDAAEAVSDGVADMASVVPIYAPGHLVIYELADKLQFPDEWVGMMATYELMTTHPDALAEAEDFNVRYFGNYTTGPTQLLTRDKPVRTGDDLQGMTIRATGSFVPAVEAFGAATVSVAQPATYEALSNGSVTGSTTYYYVVEGYKQYEVAKYMTDLDMGQTLAFGILMNLDTYNSLSPEHQALIDELGRDFTEEMAHIMYRSRTETRALLEAGIDGHKVEMVTPEPDLRARMIELAEAHGQSWIAKANEKSFDGAAIMDSFRAMVAKYQAEVDSNGYPWDR